MPGCADAAGGFDDRNERAVVGCRPFADSRGGGA
jgi:hypothetical protein